MSLRNFTGKLAVITGAGSGIGAALARSLASRSSHLALVDINGDGLALTRQSIQQNVRLSVHNLDVTDVAAVNALPAAIEEEHGTPADILVNNAGVALEGAFADVSEEDFIGCWTSTCTPRSG